MSHKTVKRRFEIERVRTIESPKLSGDSDKVHFCRVKVGRKTLFLVEKTFGMFQMLLLESYPRIAGQLRKLKLSVLPTVRILKEADGAKRLFLTDLSKGGQFKVLEYELKPSSGGGINPELKNLNNFRKIIEQIEKEEHIARENGIDLGERAWQIQVNPETNTGKPFITDLKRVGPI